MTITEEVSSKSLKDAGFDPAVHHRLEEHIQKLIGEDKIKCGSYMLSRDGVILAVNAFGPLRHDDTTSILQTDSIREIASVTKLFTSVAIFQLIEQGKLFLRQPVAEWIAEFNNSTYNKVQIWNLLTHTSGIQADPNYYLEPYPMGWWDIIFAFMPELEDKDNVDVEELERQRQTVWIRAVLSGKPLSQPGEEWSYSSAGFAILGEIIARASGKTYEQYVMDEIVHPLGLTRTFFQVPENLHPEVCVIDDHNIERLNRQPQKYHPPSSGGGLYSTIHDVFRFGQMMLNGGILDGVRILSRKSIEKMTQNTFDNNQISAYCWGANIPKMDYGIGASITGRGEWIPEGSYGHEGAGRCKLIIDPTHQSVAVFFVPSNVDWCPESITGLQNIIGSGWI
ncbi:serine hydrolase domain-containing protein [Paenibacillus crassostreae]|uniref:Beta-lactamase-related domain-containing protein n=1 Tax=Paenibacillus crassostreae TaxID=1763538 RepID=A0A167FGQ2_9BACL|nr:serine hydrolase domain-containing protein [Paenibacillus crassostreae]AOZ94422.1 hypothetical protein LPB68_20920 [Paenibacillus crassostreae]OAB76541.1 hypothetical protein PNBC_03820 [Paenibacillus crassostreae]